MKTNFLSVAVKILLFAAAIIITCVIVVLGFKTTNEGKSIANAGTSQLNAMTSDYQDVSKSIYDGSTILGSELVSLIKKTIEKKEEIAIVVVTLKDGPTGPGTHYNYNHVESTGNQVHSLGDPSSATISTTKTESKYINSSAQFTGTVYKDLNSNVVCIKFVQQK